MKLSTFVAIAAVIGGSFLIAPSADASTCNGLVGAEKTACRAEQKTSNLKARSNAVSRSCVDGTSYHKITTGGLLFKRTIAEGCFTDFQAAQLKMQRAQIRSNAMNSNSTCTLVGNTVMCY
ncbi:hypothetical protein [Synechococcus sp. UW179A]|uniref:hypothetical protein n=1 Tax=Synechococcus sp. UW179A TaxID=2575510 RepID=UPI0010BF3E86|nr:hypothetical protein [Synechococcus sp. UW179A]